MKPIERLKKELGTSRRSAPSSSRAEEKALVAAARSGDSRAMTRLLTLVSEPAMRFGRGFCRDDDDAQEIMQDVLTSLVRTLPTFRGEAALSTWAHTVARRACMRRRRRRVDAPEQIDSIDEGRGDGGGALEVPDVAADPAQRYERRRMSELLEGAISTLPLTQREVLVLRDVEGLPAPEVGRILGLNQRAVKSRLHRARVALRETLAPVLGRSTVGGARSQAAQLGRGRSCPDTARMVSRFLEGELSSSTCATLSKHVATCAHCGEVCDTLRETLGMCRAYGEKPLPGAVRIQVRSAIRAAVRSWPDHH